MILRYLFCLVLSVILLTACVGGGSNQIRNGVLPKSLDIDSYGLIRGATIVDKKTYTVEFLQRRLTPDFVSFNGTATGVCDTLTTNPEDPIYTLFVRYLCGLNIDATRDETRKNISTFDPETFAIKNTAGVVSTKFYRFIYNTPGAPYAKLNGTTSPQDASGLIIIPRDAAGNALAPDKIKGVVLYYHPTVFSKVGVPSGFDAPESSVELVNYTLYTDFMLAAVYASQGFVVVAPDYVGQGVNKDTMHPYVAFAKTNALSGIYALKAARTALAREKINLPVKANLYITSYSEGGAYALWASKLIQGEYGRVLDSSGYVLKRTAGISGAYDVSGSMLDYMYDNVKNDWDPKSNIWNVSPGMFESGFLSPAIPESAYKPIRAVVAFEAAGAKTVLSAYMVTAVVHYNMTPDAYNLLVDKRFMNMENCLQMPQYARSGDTFPHKHFDKCEFNYNLATLFNNSVLNPREIFNQTLSAAGTTGFITDGKSFNALFTSMQDGYTNNSVKAFLHKDSNFDKFIIPMLIPNNIFDWETTSPIELIYTRYDSILPNKNSLKACGRVPRVSNVKDRSRSGLVTCTEVDNTKFWQQTSIAGLDVRVPMFADHSWMEPSLQLVALSRFLANP